MKYDLGFSVTSISRPLTEESLQALESVSVARTIETNPALFPPDNGAEMQHRFMDVVRRKGLRPITYHASFGDKNDLSALNEEVRRESIERFYGELAQARDLDAEMIVLHPSFEPVLPEERMDRMKSLRLSLAEVEERVRKYGYRIAIELLPRSCLGNTPEELLQIVEDFDDDFGFTFDINHMMDRIDEIPNTVKLLGPRLFHLHISDYFGIDECHLLPGEGKIDWRAFLTALDEVGYKGCFNYELRQWNFQGQTPLEILRAIENNYLNFFGNL